MLFLGDCMFDRKIYMVKDEKKFEKYIIVKSIKVVLFFLLMGISMRTLSVLMLEYLYGETYKFNFIEIIILILLLGVLYISFYFAYKKKYIFDMIKMNEERIMIIYKNVEDVFMFDDIYIHKKKDEFSIHLNKNKIKLYTVPLSLLKGSDFKNMLTDFKKYNVRVRK